MHWACATSVFILNRFWGIVYELKCLSVAQILDFRIFFSIFHGISKVFGPSGS